MEYEVDNLIDEGVNEEEVASEHADYDDDFSATLPVDPESDQGEEEEKSEADPKQEVGDTSEVLDRRGISGQGGTADKALLSFKGLNISKEQARSISRLYDQLDSYDKKPLIFIKHKAKGRFSRSRRHVEDTSIDYIKRSFLYAASPALLIAEL